jgi:putative ABC transport system substrate-binding protein
MKRRDFIALLSVAAAPAWPCSSHAQGSKIPRVGFLGAELTSPGPLAHYQAFLDRLRDHGFSNGQTIEVEHGSTSDPRGIFVVAAELLRSQPDLVVATGPEISLQAVIGASRAIPIVMMATNFDPIGRYVASLARPGGNITGVVFRQTELAGKQVEILTQTFPDRKRLAILFDSQSADQLSAAEQTTKSLNIEFVSLKLERPPYDFAAAFGRAKASAQMVVVLSSPHFIAQASRIAELGIEHRLPTMFINSIYVDAGGLMSYGVNFPTMYRRVADYVARILKGEKAADLPVEQATKFDTVLYL